MADSTVTAVSENESVMFVVYSALLGGLVVFYFMFASRVVGRLVQVIVNTFLRLGNERYLRLGAIHVAFLVGKIHFRDLQYTTKNTSVRVLDGTIWLRWWRRPQRLEKSVDEESNNGDDDDAGNVPSMLLVQLNGVEYSIINNSYRYDQLDTVLKERAQSAKDNGKPKPEPRPPPPVETPDTRLPLIFRLSRSIALRIHRGVVIIGNSALPTFSVTSFEKATGKVFADHNTSSNLDLYRTVINLDMNGVQSKLLRNPAYKGDGHEKPKGEIGEIVDDLVQNFMSFFKEMRFTFLTGTDRDAAGDKTADSGDGGAGVGGPTGMGTADPPSLDSNSWKGLSRYITPWARRPRAPIAPPPGSGTPCTAKPAKAPMVLQCPSLAIMYHVDAAGVVPPRVSQEDREFNARQGPDLLAGIWEAEMSVHPQWGVELDVRGGSVCYGPWEDRQRFLIQKYFLPSTFEDLKIYKPVVGQYRAFDGFKTEIRFRGITEFAVQFPAAVDPLVNPNAPPNTEPAPPPTMDGSVASPADGRDKPLSPSGDGTGAFELGGDAAKEPKPQCLKFVCGPPTNTDDKGNKGDDVDGDALDNDADISRLERGRSWNGGSPTPTASSPPLSTARRDWGMPGSVHSTFSTTHRRGPSDAFSISTSSPMKSGNAFSAMSAMSDEDGPRSVDGKSAPNNQLSEEEMRDSLWDGPVRVAGDEGSEHDLYEENMEDLDDHGEMGELEVAITITNFLPYLCKGPEGCVGSTSVLATDVTIWTTVQSVQGPPTPLIVSDALSIVIAQQYPVVWNAPRVWSYEVEFQHPLVRLMRNHIRAITDLIGEWAKGDPIPRMYFVPVHYDISVRMLDHDLVFNVNEDNVVDDMSSTTENALATISGDKLESVIGIPKLLWSNPTGEIVFDVTLTRPRCVLSPPKHSSLDQRLEPDPFLDMDTVVFQGNWTYYFKYAKEHFDSFSLDIAAVRCQMTLHNFYLHYMWSFISNLFGDNCYFISSQEYEKRQRRNTNKIDMNVHSALSGAQYNAFEFYLSASFQDVTFLLPHALYTTEGSATAFTPQFDVEMRTLPIYQDLKLSLGPITIDFPLQDDESPQQGSFAPRSGGDGSDESDGDDHADVIGDADYFDSGAVAAEAPRPSRHAKGKKGREGKKDKRKESRRPRGGWFSTLSKGTPAGMANVSGVMGSHRGNEMKAGLTFWDTPSSSSNSVHRDNAIDATSEPHEGAGSGSSGLNGGSKPRRPRRRSRGLFVHGIEFHRHALYGPAPRCLTYRTIVETTVGDICGVLDTPHVQALSLFWSAWSAHSGHRDRDIATYNSWKRDYAYGTNRLKLGQVDVSLVAPDALSVIELPDGISMLKDSLINSLYNTRTRLKIPKLIFKVWRFDQTDDSNPNNDVRLDPKHLPRHAVGSVSFGVTLSWHTQSSMWETDMRRQWAFLMKQDEPTRRCAFLSMAGGAYLDVSGKTSQTTDLSGTDVDTDFEEGRQDSDPIARSILPDQAPMLRQHIGNVFGPGVAVESPINGNDNQPDVLQDERSDRSDRTVELESDHVGDDSTDGSIGVPRLRRTGSASSVVSVGTDLYVTATDRSSLGTGEFMMYVDADDATGGSVTPIASSDGSSAGDEIWSPAVEWIDVPPSDKGRADDGSRGSDVRTVNVSGKDGIERVAVNGDANVSNVTPTSQLPRAATMPSHVLAGLSPPPPRLEPRPATHTADGLCERARLQWRAPPGTEVHCPVPVFIENTHGIVGPMSYPSGKNRDGIEDVSSAANMLEGVSVAACSEVHSGVGKRFMWNVDPSMLRTESSVVDAYGIDDNAADGAPARSSALGAGGSAVGNAAVGGGYVYRYDPTSRPESGDWGPPPMPELESRREKFGSRLPPLEGVGDANDPMSQEDTFVMRGVGPLSITTSMVVDAHTEVAVVVSPAFIVALESIYRHLYSAPVSLVTLSDQLKHSEVKPQVPSYAFYNSHLINSRKAFFIRRVRIDLLCNAMARSLSEPRNSIPRPTATSDDEASPMRRPGLRRYDSHSAITELRSEAMRPRLGSTSALPAASDEEGSDGATTTDAGEGGAATTHPTVCRVLIEETRFVMGDTRMAPDAETDPFTVGSVPSAAAVGPVVTSQSSIRVRGWTATSALMWPDNSIRSAPCSSILTPQALSSNPCVTFTDILPAPAQLFPVVLAQMNGAGASMLHHSTCAPDGLVNRRGALVSIAPDAPKETRYTYDIGDIRLDVSDRAPRHIVPMLLLWESATKTFATSRNKIQQQRSALLNALLYQSTPTQGQHVRGVSNGAAPAQRRVSIGVDPTGFAGSVQSLGIAHAWVHRFLQSLSPTAAARLQDELRGMQKGCASCQERIGAPTTAALFNRSGTWKPDKEPPQYGRQSERRFDIKSIVLVVHGPEQAADGVDDPQTPATPPCNNGEPSWLRPDNQGPGAKIDINGICIRMASTQSGPSTNNRNSVNLGSGVAAGGGGGGSLGAGANGLTGGPSSPGLGVSKSPFGPSVAMPKGPRGAQRRPSFPLGSNANNKGKLCKDIVVHAHIDKVRGALTPAVIGLVVDVADLATMKGKRAAAAIARPTTRSYGVGGWPARKVAEPPKWKPRVRFDEGNIQSTSSGVAGGVAGGGGGGGGGGGESFGVGYVGGVRVAGSKMAGSVGGSPSGTLPRSPVSPLGILFRDELADKLFDTECAQCLRQRVVSRSGPGHVRRSSSPPPAMEWAGLVEEDDDDYVDPFHHVHTAPKVHAAMDDFADLANKRQPKLPRRPSFSNRPPVVGKDASAGNELRKPASSSKCNVHMQAVCGDVAGTMTVAGVGRFLARATSVTVGYNCSTSQVGGDFQCSVPPGAATAPTAAQNGKDHLPGSASTAASGAATAGDGGSEAGVGGDGGDGDEAPPLWAGATIRPSSSSFVRLTGTSIRLEHVSGKHGEVIAHWAKTKSIVLDMNVGQRIGAAPPAPAPVGQLRDISKQLWPIDSLASPTPRSPTTTPSATNPNGGVSKHNASLPVLGACYGVFLLTEGTTAFTPVHKLDGAALRRMVNACMSAQQRIERIVRQPLPGSGSPGANIGLSNDDSVLSARSGTSALSSATDTPLAPMVSVVVDILDVSCSLQLLQTVSLTYEIPRMTPTLSQGGWRQQRAQVSLNVNTSRISYVSRPKPGAESTTDSIRNDQPVHSFTVPRIRSAGTIVPPTSGMFSPRNPATLGGLGLGGSRAQASLSAPADPNEWVLQLFVSFESVANEINAEILNQVLMLQKTMSTELNYFLEAAVKTAAGTKRRLRDSRHLATQTSASLRLRFDLTVLLEGFRLVAVAPTATLLLDSGAFSTHLQGRTAPPVVAAPSTHATPGARTRSGSTRTPTSGRRSSASSALKQSGVAAAVMQSPARHLKRALFAAGPDDTGQQGAKFTLRWKIELRGMHIAITNGSPQTGRVHFVAHGHTNIALQNSLELLRDKHAAPTGQGRGRSATWNASSDPPAPTRGRAGASQRGAPRHGSVSGAGAHTTGPRSPPAANRRGAGAAAAAAASDIAQAQDSNLGVLVQGSNVTAHPGVFKAVLALWGHYSAAYNRYQSDRLKLQTQAQENQRLNNRLRSMFHSIEKDFAHKLEEKEQLIGNLALHLRLLDTDVCFGFASAVQSRDARDAHALSKCDLVSIISAPPPPGALLLALGEIGCFARIEPHESPVQKAGGISGNYTAGSAAPKPVAGSRHRTVRSHIRLTSLIAGFKEYNVDGHAASSSKTSSSQHAQHTAMARHGSLGLAMSPMLNEDPFSGKDKEQPEFPRAHNGLMQNMRNVAHIAGGVSRLHMVVNPTAISVHSTTQLGGAHVRIDSTAIAHLHAIGQAWSTTYYHQPSRAASGHGKGEGEGLGASKHTSQRSASSARGGDSDSGDDATSVGTDGGSVSMISRRVSGDSGSVGVGAGGVAQVSDSSEHADVSGASMEQSGGEANVDDTDTHTTPSVGRAVSLDFRLSSARGQCQIFSRRSGRRPTNPAPRSGSVFGNVADSQAADEAGPLVSLQFPAVRLVGCLGMVIGGPQNFGFAAPPAADGCAGPFGGHGGAAPCNFIHVVLQQDAIHLSPSVITVLQDVATEIKRINAATPRKRVSSVANADDPLRRMHAAATSDDAGAGGVGAADSDLPKGTMAVCLRMMPLRITLSGQPATDTIAVLNFTHLDAMASYMVSEATSDGVCRRELLQNLTFLLPEARLQLQHPSPADPKVMQVAVDIAAREVRINAGQALDAASVSMLAGCGSVRRVALEVNAKLLDEAYELTNVWSKQLQVTAASSTWVPAGHEDHHSGGGKRGSKSGSSAGRGSGGTGGGTRGADDSAVSGRSMFMSIRVDTLTTIVNLGDPWGTMQLQIQPIFVNVNDPKRISVDSTVVGRSVSLSTGNTKVKFAGGKLQGLIVNDGVYSHSQAVALPTLMRSRKTRQPQRRAPHRWLVQMGGLAGNLDYDGGLGDLERILSLKVGGVGVRVRDAVSAADQGRSHVQAVVTYDGVVVRVSSETAPSLIKVVTGIIDAVRRRPGQPMRRESTLSIGDKSLDDIRTYASDGPNWADMDDFTPDNSERSNNTFSFADSRPVDNVTVGDMTIEGANLSVSLYNYSIEKESDWLQITIEDFRANLAQNMIGKEVKRILTAAYSNSSMAKMTKGRTYSKGTIILVPDARLEMATVQKLGSPIVECHFYSWFKRPLDVTTNIGLYTFLRQLAQQYQSEMGKARSSKTATTRTIDADTHGRGAADTIGAERRDREYRCVHFRLEPRLSVLGDATPRVDTVLEWLGITDREVIISAVHSGLTDLLEAALKHSCTAMEKL